MSKTLPLLVLLLSLGAFAQTSTYSVNVDQNMACTSLQKCRVTNTDGSTTSWAGAISEGWVTFYGSCVGVQYTTYTYTNTTFSVSCNNGVLQTSIAGTWKLGSCSRGVCFHDIVSAQSSITATPETLHSLGVPGY